MTPNCWSHHLDPYGMPAAARLTFPATGHTVPMCPRHLNEYLDLADDHPHLEPAALTWFPGHPQQTAA